MIRKLDLTAQLVFPDCRKFEDLFSAWQPWTWEPASGLPLPLGVVWKFTEWSAETRRFRKRILYIGPHCEVRSPQGSYTYLEAVPSQQLRAFFRWH